MAKFKNVSPLGALDIPAVGVVGAGEEFEVDDALVEHFIGQTENYELVTVPAATAQAATAPAKTEGSQDDDAA